jgi:hypothetical protein
MSRFVLLLRIILGPRGRYVLCWIAALTITGILYYQARHVYSSDRHEEAKRRPDGQLGHALIDFGGQWVMARMMVAGYGHELYSRTNQWEVLKAAYPRSDEATGQVIGDARRLFEWMVDIPLPDPSGAHRDALAWFNPTRPAIGGPLYPPTHALLFAPLGLLPPKSAYHLMQVLLLGMTWLAGAAVAGISGGRLWWPAAAAFLMVFPGYQGSLYLGQNSILSLTILTAGWYLVSRGNEWAGGAVWGLLAYKPVWAAAFVLVPLLTGRWRMLIGMIVGGLVFVLATLPAVGIDQWVNWFRVGREGAANYNVDENWIFLGRDLLGIPRRWLLDFQAPIHNVRERDRPAAAVAGWALWLAVVGTTTAVALARRRLVRTIDGYGAAFLGIGAWASCYHFIYYDVALAAFPVALLLTNPWRFLRPTLLAAEPVPEELRGYYSPRLLRELPRDTTSVPVVPRSAAVLNSMVLTCVALLILIEQGFNNVAIGGSVSIEWLPTSWSIPQPLRFSTTQQGTPWDTFVLLGLWAYCGARGLMSSPEYDLKQIH